MNHSAPLPPERWAEEAAYLEGIRLFNAREFWESHEAWEEIWLGCEGPQAEFLQGLIQCAAALLKFSRQQPAPALRLYDAAMLRLDGCPERFMGLDVRAFQAAMRECFQPLLKGPPAPMDPAKVPRLEPR